MTHIQEDEPECRVVLGGGRIRKDGRTDDRRIELAFENVLWARVGPHPDNANIEYIGYQVEDGFAEKGYAGSNDVSEQMDWMYAYWLREGICPDSGFYIASDSDWLASLKTPNDDFNFKHYVIDDRDGYVEVISTGYSWKEWLWTDGHREDLVANSDWIHSASGTD